MAAVLRPTQPGSFGFGPSAANAEGAMSSIVIANVAAIVRARIMRLIRRYLPSYSNPRKLLLL